MACIQTQQWRVKMCHFHYPKKLQSKASKHGVWRKIINAFRSQIIRILHAKNYECWFRILQVLKDWTVHNFMRHSIFNVNHKLYNTLQKLRCFNLCYIFLQTFRNSLKRFWQYITTRSSADADNGLDAFSGQSRSTNMVPFWFLCDISLSMWPTPRITRGSLPICHFHSSSSSSSSRVFI